MTEDEYEFWMHIECAMATLKSLHTYCGESFDVLNKDSLDEILDSVAKDIYKAQEYLE